MELALFDFDGTITTKDASIEFMKKYTNKFKLFISPIFIIPLLIICFLKLIKLITAMEIMLIYFFKNWKKEKFDYRVNQYISNHMHKILRKKAIERIEWHQKRNHQVVIITGALDLVLQPWCDEMGIDLIATNLEVKDQKITGRLSTPRCRGIEKVRRIKEKYRLEEYSKIYAYGDNKGDKEMLAIADEKFYRYFEE